VEKVFDIRPPGKKRARRKASGGQSRPKAKSSKRKLFSYKKELGVLFVVFLASLFAIFHFSAKVKIEIWPQTSLLSFEETIVADSQILASVSSEKTIPGRIFSTEKELSKAFSSSGKTASEAKASGKITIFNDYHLNQVLVTRTRFLSADGKLFYLTERTEIPARGSREVMVAAAEAGPEYNIKATTFSVPGLLGSSRYTAVYAESYSIMSGGSQGESSQVLESDLELAEKTLSDSLLEEAKKELEALAGSEFLLLKEAIEEEVLKSSSSAEAGQIAKSFDFYFKADYRAMAFKKKESERLAETFVLERISEDEEIKKESLRIEPMVESVDLENGKLFLNLKISAEIMKKINLDDLKKSLSGKSLKESRVFLSSYSEIRKTKLRLFPFWIQTMPQDLEKIIITINSSPLPPHVTE